MDGIIFMMIIIIYIFPFAYVKPTCFLSFHFKIPFFIKNGYINISFPFRNLPFSLKLTFKIIIVTWCTHYKESTSFPLNEFLESNWLVDHVDVAKHVWLIQKHIFDSMIYKSK